ncbi:MAG: ornithine carbamoyltransferase [Aquificaceae bacterium]|nr:ornithine carbamoyltransferase [Aquificaceae bacterium]MDW8237562.1 ornithine carbamoyltransferase [Aquificaceae bacterium]
MKRDFVELDDLSPEEGWKVIDWALGIKRGSFEEFMKKRVVGLYFRKPSTRTRVSFEVGVAKLGGTCIFLQEGSLQASRGEELRDTARTLSEYLDLIVVRAEHQFVKEMARWAKVPIINALTEMTHPCQVLGDVLTLCELFGKDLKGVKVAYLGDGNNVCNTLLIGAGMFGFDLSVASPKGYEPSEEYLSRALRLSKSSGARIEVINDPKKAIEGANVIYTDVWFSMNHSKDENRRRDLEPFRVSEALIENRNVKIMHCLPANKGEEIEEKVFEEHADEIFLQAKNRMFAQMGLLKLLLAK